MSSQVVSPQVGGPANGATLASPGSRKHRHAGTSAPFRFPAYAADGDIAQRQAELFYLQKQIQSQTPMVIVLQDDEEIHGVIEWYDKYCLKVNRIGEPNVLIYKPSIKYIFKESESKR